MKPDFNRYRIILIALFALSICNSVFAADGRERGSVSLATEYTSGNYNSDSSIQSLYMPLTITIFPTDRIDLAVEIPFVYQNSSVVTTSLYNSNSVAAAKILQRGGPGGMYGAGQGYAATSSGTTSGYYNYNSSSSDSVSGLGDIILKAGYIALFEQEKMPQIRFSAFVKTPSADVSEGLGTGKFDYGAGFDISKWFDKFQLAAESAYNIQGKVDGYGLKNYVTYNFSAGYLIKEFAKPSIQIKGGTAPSQFSDDLLEVRAKSIFYISAKNDLELYLSKGISESSPDYGAGIALTYLF